MFSKVKVVQIFAGEIQIEVSDVGVYNIHEDSHSQVLKVYSPISGSHCFEWSPQEDAWIEYNNVFQSLDSMLEFEFMDLTDGYL